MLTRYQESSPLKVHKRTYQAFNECKMYFEELFDLKKKQIDLGESEKGTMDLMGRFLEALTSVLHQANGSRTYDTSKL